MAPVNACLKLTLLVILALANFVSFGKSDAQADRASSGGAGARTSGSSTYCTPYEWQNNPHECFQRAYNFANSFPVLMPPVSDNSYLRNWRANFDSWQQNFQAQVQQNLLQMQQEFANLEAQIRAQQEYTRTHGGGTGNPNFQHSFHQQSSSFSGDSGGASETVMSSSNNDGSWTIRASGLGISSVSNGNQITISVYIGDAETYESKIISDKELLIEVFKRNDPVKRWMSIKVTAGTLRVQDFQVSRPQADTLLVQSAPLPPNAVGAGVQSG